MNYSMLMKILEVFGYINDSCYDIYCCNDFDNRGEVVVFVGDSMEGLLVMLKGCDIVVERINCEYIKVYVKV